MRAFKNSSTHKGVKQFYDNLGIEFRIMDNGDGSCSFYKKQERDQDFFYLGRYKISFKSECPLLYKKICEIAENYKLKVEIEE